jgi:uncharacterized membrane protein
VRDARSGILPLLVLLVVGILVIIVTVLLQPVQCDYDQYYCGDYGASYDTICCWVVFILVAIFVCDIIIMAAVYAAHASVCSSHQLELSSSQICTSSSMLINEALWANLQSTGRFLSSLLDAGCLMLLQAVFCQRGRCLMNSQ